MWSFVERYIGLLIGIASTVILARLLTPAEVGVYSLCAAFTAVAGMLRDFGVSEYLIQERELTRERIRSAYGVAVITAWIIAAGIWLGRDTAAGFYAEPRVAEVLAVLTLNFLLLPLSSPAFALMNRQMEFKQIFHLNTACNIVHAATAITLAYRGFGAISLAWAPVASIVTQTALLAIFRPRESFILPSLHAARDVLRFGMQFVSARFFETISRNIHEPIIGKQFDFTAVGLFSRAWGLIDMFHLNVTVAILRVATPAFAADHHAGISQSERFARGTAIYTSLAWPFYTFVILGSHEIVDLMFGAQWLASAPIASLLVLAISPQCLSALAPQFLSATGHVNRRLRIAMFVMPIHVAAVLLASFNSLEAIGAVFAIQSCVSLALYTWQLRKVLGVSVRELFGPSLLSLWLAFTCAAGQAGTLVLGRTLSWPVALTLAAMACATTIAWLFAGRLLGHPVYREVAKMLASARLRLAKRRRPS